MRNPTSTVTALGTLDRTDSYAMSIDPAGMAHIMSVLTNLYSNAPLAREYATNAHSVWAASPRSPLGQQFIVTATKHGQRVTILLAIGEAGIGTVTLLDHASVTGAPNGVTVAIAVFR